MAVTARNRLLNTCSGDEEDGRGTRNRRRRVTYVERRSRRRHDRAYRLRLFFRTLPMQRAMLLLLLLLVTGAAPFVGLYLVALAPSSIPPVPADGSENDVCRNTVQGVALLADSEGRVCQRANLDHRRPGCCNALPLSWAAGGGGGRWRKVGGGVEEAATPRTPTAAIAHRHLSGRQEGAEDGVPPEEALSTPFSCWSCDVGESGATSSSCCASYEFCVSCCQDPQRKEEREAVRAEALSPGHPFYGSPRYVGGGSGAAGSGKVSAPGLPLRGRGDEIDDDNSYRQVVFDRCAFRCRTYSGSVVSENSYRGPLKYCFGRCSPPAAPGVASNSGGGGVDCSLASQGGGSPPRQLDPMPVSFIGESKSGEKGRNERNVYFPRFGIND